MDAVLAASTESGLKRREANGAFIMEDETVL